MRTAALTVTGEALLLRFDDGSVLQITQSAPNEISVGSPGQMGEVRARCG